MKTSLSALAVAAACTLFGLSACGGGSSAVDAGAGVPPPAADPPADAAAFTLQLSTDKAVILQGGSATLQARIERRAGFDAAVSVELTGLPAGVSASTVLIPAGANSAELLLSAEAGAPHSLPTGANASGRAAGQTAQRPLTVTVRGLPGLVDTSFAGGALVTPVDNGEDHAHAVAVQADGKLLMAGASATAGGTRLSLVRYLRDGGVDTSFGVGGKVITALGSQGDDSARAIAVQPDGMIVVAGASHQGASGLDFALVRYRADGTLDAGFGSGGKVITDFGSASDRAWSLLVAGDGKIVVGGETNTGASAGGVDFALARYLADGTLDASFGLGGKVVTALKSAAGSDVVRALAVQTVDGASRLLAVGGEGDFLAARYTDSGALDSGFGSNGKLVGLFNASIGAAHAVVALPSGGAVLAGHVGHDFAAVKLTPAGQPDPGFGAAHDGRFVMAVSATNWDEATALARQADGKLVLGGWAFSGNSSAGDFAALRLHGDGSLDTGFGNHGVTIRPIAAGARNDQAHALTLQPDDRIPSVRAILGGEANGSNHDFALTRLWL